MTTICKSFFCYCTYKSLHQNIPGASKYTVAHPRCADVASPALVDRDLEQVTVGFYDLAEADKLANSELFPPSDPIHLFSSCELPAPLALQLVVDDFYVK